MTSDEIRLNPFLEHHGISPYETDLADLILQLGEDDASGRLSIITARCSVNSRNRVEYYAWDDCVFCLRKSLGVFTEKY